MISRNTSTFLRATTPFQSRRHGWRRAGVSETGQCDCAGGQRGNIAVATHDRGDGCGRGKRRLGSGGPCGVGKRRLGEHAGGELIPPNIPNTPFPCSGHKRRRQNCCTHLVFTGIAAAIHTPSAETDDREPDDDRSNTTSNPTPLSSLSSSP